jgi:hypothetical protein
MQSSDMEENENISIWNINNMVLQIIPREHNLIFIGEQEKFGDQVRNIPVCLARPSLIAGITSLLSNLVFSGKILNTQILTI